MAFTFANHVLVTPELFEAFTGLDDASMSAADKMSTELLVNASSKQILQFTGRLFKQGTFSEVWDGQDSDLILTTEYPVISVTSVKFSFNGDFASQQAIDPQLYGVDPSGSSISFRGNVRTPLERACVQVVYQAGYATIPEDLQLASLLQYKFLASLKSGGGMIGLDSIAKMQESQRKDQSLKRGGLISEVVGMLESYRRIDAPMSVSFARVT